MPLLTPHTHMCAVADELNDQAACFAIILDELEAALATQHFTTESVMKTHMLAAAPHDQWAGRHSPLR
ncbi:hypothetical protein OH708_03765 [Pseudomonas capsici]|uniref:hypothetical protein n=1 Tax=Pseudomonas capsici TaxID=2810614 RepID=UPI0021F1E0AF|nr:hypothetical protein [Pseudomonas capsici]MCV4287018.1 hypothetical protein [Pseudomonas capsici]